MAIKVSVVVPTYKRPDLLRRCLDALVAQDLDAADYEVIVADDAADLATRELVEALGAIPQIRYVAVQGAHGPAAARNRGWRAAVAPIIAFTDDDTVPTPQWLRTGIDSLTDEVAGLAGRIVVPLPETPTDFERNMAGLEQAEFATANCFYRRSALEAVGGFDERFTSPWREDADLFFTLTERGYRLATAPDAVVVHPLRPGSWAVSLRQQRQNIFDALLYKKHPELYRRRIPRSGWRYYRIAAAMMAVAGAALAGAPLLALLGASAWAAMTSQFLLQRLAGTSRAPRHVAEMLLTSVLIPPVAIFWRLRGAVKYRVAFL